MLGVAGFLVWGIPMSIMIAGVFAKAWRREQFGLGTRLLRGVAWFVLYLVTIALRERIALAGDETGAIRVLLFAAALIPVWVFWSLTPVLLVRDGGRGPKYLALAGLAGLVIDGIVIPLAARLSLPAVASRLGGLRPHRSIDGFDDVVRSHRHRMGRDGVRGRGAVGTYCAVGHRRGVTDRRGHPRQPA